MGLDQGYLYLLEVYYIIQLKQTLAEWPSILLPSHRSYLDFILVSYLMFEHNITLPCIAAGQGKLLGMNKTLDLMIIIITDFMSMAWC